MDDETIVISSGAVFSPESVAARTFATGFRGYDQSEVRAYLKRVADELSAAATREAELQEALLEAHQKAAHPDLDEETLTAALGEHSARLLTNAREAAANIVAEAEKRAARIIGEAEVRISRVRSEADGLLARRSEEADRMTSGLRQAAEATARTLRDRARAEAEAEVESARKQGRDMVGEARAVRERMLADLTRRRRTAEVQIEHLRTARVRLLEAYAVVRRTLDEATHELGAAEAEAGPVLDAAAGRAPRGSASTADDLRRPPSSDRRPGPGPAPGRAGEHHQQRPAVSAPSAQELAGPPGRGLVSVGGTGSQPSPPGDVAAEVAPGTGFSDDRPTTDRRTTVDVPRAGGGEVAERVSKTDPAGAASPAATADEGPLPEPAAIVELPAPAAPASPAATPAPVVAPPPVEVSALSTSTSPEPAPPAPTAATPPASKPAESPDSSTAPAPPASPPPTSTPPVAPPPAPAPASADELFARLRAAQAPPSPPPPAPSPAPAASMGPAPSSSAKNRNGAATAPTPQAAQHALGTTVTVREESALAGRDQLLEPIQTDLLRRLKRVLQDEQNEVLDRLRRERHPTIDVVLPTLDAHVERYQSAAVSLLGRAADRGAEFVSSPQEAAGSASVEGGAPSGGWPAEQWAADLAVDLVVPLRDRLEEAISEAMAWSSASGGTAYDTGGVSEKLSASYRQWKSTQLEQATRHHASAAFSRGAFAATPPGAQRCWVVDDDGGPCPDCDDNTLAGAVTKGQPFPTGQTHPPAHDGCRCILVLPPS